MIVSSHIDICSDQQSVRHGLKTEGDKMKSKSQTFLTRVFMLVLVAFLLLPVSAFAQGRGRTDDWRRNDRWDRNDRWRRNDDNDWNRRGRNGDGYGNYGGSFQLRQTALNAGYNNGIQEGRKDRQRGERFEFRDEGDYQQATEDYSSRLGNRELYRQYFREGFANGYRAGFSGY
jgi:hypothetical protein